MGPWQLMTIGTHNCLAPGRGKRSDNKKLTRTLVQAALVQVAGELVASSSAKMMPLMAGSAGRSPSGVKPCASRSKPAMALTSAQVRRPSTMTYRAYIQYLATYITTVTGGPMSDDKHIFDGIQEE